MDEFRWFKISLLLFTAGFYWASGWSPPRIYVRDGDEATLPCEHVKNNQKKCDGINWLFNGSENLIEDGEKTGDKSDRLSLLKNCSLVIRKVSAEDVGYYTCRQSRNDAHVLLFLITMTEQKNAESVTLSCSVSLCMDNEHSVNWLYDNENDDKDNIPKETSPSICSVSVSLPNSYAQHKPKYHETFKCKVTDHHIRKEHYFTFHPHSSGETPDEKATTTTTTLTIRTTENNNETRTNLTGSTIKDWLLYAVGAAGLAALVMIIVVIIVCKRTKGKKTEKDENTGQRLNPAVTESAPQTSLDTADPEDGVSYASISYTKKNNKARVQVKYDDDDEGDTVTYSTVKVPSSSAGASNDPSPLYASIK